MNRFKQTSKVKKAFLIAALVVIGCQGLSAQGKPGEANKYWREDEFFKSNYANVEFSNVNGFLMLANSIRTYQNESQKKNVRGSNDPLNFSSPWDFSNLYNSTIGTINTAKYTSYQLVDWLNSVEDDMSELSAASYFYRYKAGHIEKDPRYTGVSRKGDSLMKVALPMLEEFASVIRYDNNIAELSPLITSYLTWVDQVINEQFSWLNHKTKKPYAYITAKVSPFDFRHTIRTYENKKKSSTLFQTGCGMVYDSWSCHANAKCEHPFFQSLCQPFIEHYLKESNKKDECFRDFLCSSLYLAYCKEKGGNELYQIELENRLCSYNGKNKKCGKLTFIEFHEEFNKIYYAKGNKGKMDVLCQKMQDFVKENK